MIRNHILLALRNIAKHKLFSLINIAGLSLGLTAAIILFLFARYQLTYDQYHSNADNLYIVYKERITPTGTQPTYDTWHPLLGQLKADFPEVKTGTRINESGVMVEANGNRFSESCYYVDPAYFNVFDFPLALGDNNNPLPTKNSAIISQELAKKFFGEENPIGKPLIINFEKQYTVSGVLKEYPQNSSIASELIFHIQSQSDYADWENDWGSSSLFTVIQLDEAASAEALSSKFPSLIKKLWNEDIQKRTNFKLLPIAATFETFVGDPKDVYILLIVGIGLVLIVTINFINLSTARTLDRSKEVSMRKVFGAQRGQLIQQFLYESLLMSVMALAVSILAVKILLPIINQHFELHLYLNLSNLVVCLSLFVVSMFLGLLAGIIPSSILSGLQIQRGLKSFTSNRAHMRNVLVTLQFGISIVLLISVIIIGKQINFMKTINMGYQTDNQLIIPISVNDFAEADVAQQRLESFKQTISEYSAVKSISSSRHVPLNWSGSNVFVRPEGWQDEPLRMRYTFHDADFLSTYRIPVIEGPGFKEDSFGDQRESVMINEATMRAFGWNSIINKSILIGNQKIEVVGLIKDFNFETVQNEIAPTLHFHRTPSNQIHRYITINVASGNKEEVVDFVKSKWSILDASETLPFNYYFLDETIDRVYQNENQLFNMIKAFTFIIIAVACMGLYGLSSFTLERKKKEIGIRKVLGASVIRITTMFFQRYLLLILISFGFAIPISLYLMNEWLSGYIKHTSITVDVFLISLLAIVFISLLTIASKILHVATRNPASVIKEDN
ncbi:MAG: ABC transporter permease [Cyclobacteriaceae bacterium]|nr:ABC transporter permease [Cyclobacteriaceae bacterium]